MKFVFYQSHEDTGFVGEARIKRVVLMEDPMKFYGTFGVAGKNGNQDGRAEVSRRKSSGCP